MSVLIGFTIIVMLMLLGYTAYRLYMKKDVITLISVSLQVCSVSLGIISFFNGVEAINIIQAAYILFGIIIPLAFLLADYRMMICKIKGKGIYDGLIEQKKECAGDDDRMAAFKPIKKEVLPGEIVKSLDLTDDELLKNMKGILVQAQTHISRKEYAKASDIYKIVTKLVKSCPEVYYNLANIDFLTGGYSHAANHYEKAIELYTRYRYDSTQTNSKRAERSDTIKEFSYLPCFYYNLGNANCKLKRYDSAIEAFENAIKYDCNFSDANENKARVYIMKGDYKRAAEAFKCLSDNNRNDFTISLTLGKLLIETDEKEKAAEYLQKCIEIKSDSFEALEVLAKLYFGMGKYKDAIDLSNRAEKIRPGNYSFYFCKGSACYRAGRLKEAEEAFKEAILLKPEGYKAYFNLSNVMDDVGKKPEAINALKKVIELKTDFIEAYNNLGIILSTLGRHIEALEVYKKGIDENPDCYGLYYNMGITLTDIGKYDKAVEAFKKAVKLEPDHYELYCHMGAALVGLGKYDGAVDVYNKAIEVKQPDSELFYNLASVYSLLRKHDIALENLKKAIELNDEYRNEAVSDHSFDSLRHIPEFRDLVS